MTSIEAFCARVNAPMPWRMARTWSRTGEHHTVIAANGIDLNKQLYDTEQDARTMTALTAFAPQAMAYVEEAAAKGGKEAKALAAAFRRACETPVLERSL